MLENCLKSTELCSENVLNTANEKPNETLDHQNHKSDHKTLGNNPEYGPPHQTGRKRENKK